MPPLLRLFPAVGHLRAHERYRRRAHEHSAGNKRRQHREKNARRKHRHSRQERYRGRRYVEGVINVIRTEDEALHHEPCRGNSRSHSEGGRRNAVEHIFREHFPVSQPERLARAHLLALLVHHLRDGSVDNERPDYYKKQRKGLFQLREVAASYCQLNIAGISVPVEDVPFAGLGGTYFLPHLLGAYRLAYRGERL